MKVTTKELRLQPGKIINLVANGQEVTIKKKRFLLLFRPSRIWNWSRGWKIKTNF